jgi:hypothetical protein
MVNYLSKVGRVAQLVEQCPFKAWVEGSSPSALTNIFLDLIRVRVQAPRGSHTFNARHPRARPLAANCKGDCAPTCIASMPAKS